MLDGRLKEHILFKMVLRISQNFSKYGLKGYHFILRDLDIPTWEKRRETKATATSHIGIKMKISSLMKKSVILWSFLGYFETKI